MQSCFKLKINPTFKYFKVFDQLWTFKLPFAGPSSSSSFELFILSIMQEDVRYKHYVCAQARFASLQLDWATTTGRLLGPAPCLPHEDGASR